MNRARLLDVLIALAAEDAENVARHLCATCAEVVSVAGAGVMIMGPEDSWAVLCASNGVAAAIGDLQYTLGEGPCVEAHLSGAPVAEPHLAQPLPSRWPVFAPAALAAGAAALFSFPLRMGGVHLGALTLHQTRAGELSDEQHLDALAMADLVLQVVLARQAEAPAGALADELEVLSEYRAEVHQASGMVSVQLGVSVADALVRLRSHAYAEGRPLAGVAEDVVTRRLRLSA